MGRHDLWTAVGAVPITRDVVRVHGPEARDYLQGQLSQDLAAIAEGASAWSLLLQPTGKVAAWLRVTVASDADFLLDVDAGWGDTVAARLGRFKLRTKAEIDQATWPGFAVRGPGAESASAGAAPAGRSLPIAWPGVEGADLLEVDAPPSDLPVASPEDLEVLRIECGVPAMGAELTEATIPAEAGAWLVEASVSFTKGCYTGQELVARIDSRGGNVPKPVRGLLVDGGPAVVGAPVRHQDKVVGEVTSSATSPTLGVIALAPLARSVPPGEAVMIGDELALAATVADLPLR